MLMDWFWTGFGLGLGLLSAVLAVAAVIGILETVNHKLKWRRTFGGRP